MNEAAHCSFRRVLQNNYFGKISLITFIDTSSKMRCYRFFSDSLLIVSYLQGALRKEQEAACCSFRRAS